MHCGRFIDQPHSRREMLLRSANGFGALALASLLGDSAFGGRSSVAAEAAGSAAFNPLAPRPPQYRARAKNVIFLFMDGGPSQVDTFDPKPRLTRENGQPIKMKVPPTQFDNVGKVFQSPWTFKPYGQSGIPVSELFANVGQCVDDLAVIRSMTADFSEHTNANYFMHTGHGQQGRPSLGAWATYGLGSECQNLPGFIVLNSGLIPPGGVDCFNSGFLPASFQGSSFRNGDTPVADISRREASQLQQRKLALMRRLDGRLLERTGPEDKLESAIANYELAFRMQAAVPELMNLSGESDATKQLYGLDQPHTEIYGRQCLIARRLVERGVRFIEILCQNIAGADRWDQHLKLKEGHANNARAVDKPIAGLLKDLKSRGLLDETLVLWGGEFGRTPMAQGGDGRDHNPFGFTIWLAGGGVKGGTVYGATDDYGYYAVENKTSVHDLHATILHLLGIDHKRLTYRFGGRDVRLTDVYGEVLQEILA